MAHYKKILAALDGGDTQAFIAHRALVIAHNENAEVLFAHGMEDSDLRVAHLDSEKYVIQCKESIEEALAEELAAAAQDECIPAVNVVVKAGHANDVLGEIAKEYKPDLVICGKRGFTGLKAAFLGSVSTYLVRHMKCDVLVVRPEGLADVKEQ